MSGSARCQLLLGQKQDLGLVQSGCEFGGMTEDIQSSPDSLSLVRRARRPSLRGPSAVYKELHGSAFFYSAVPGRIVF